MKEKSIKVGFCVSYDWILLKKSIPLIYAYSDLICLSIDRNRKTWNGQKYAFDEKEFRNFILAIDSNHKIDVYEDDFSIDTLSAMENDTRQRLLMAARMGSGGWHLQIDSDEYFLNFKNIILKLKSLNQHPTGLEKPINVCVFCIPLIKRLSTGYLFVDFKNKLPESFPFATTSPTYHRARLNGHFNIYLPEFVIHETWARSDDELWLKITSWGHSSEELDAELKKISYYNLWKSLDEYNYDYLTNFHPAIAEIWPAIQFMKTTSVEDLLHKFTPPKISRIKLLIKNNRTIARLKSLMIKIFG